ncbi:MAG: LysR family transcriptional regulator [Nitriliruptoraceae bacterium]|nr:LysR family transcriptional regulator [Nitriliruptoraceae bacterium]
MSQQLATLEREAGVALLERSARTAQLTPAGRRLVVHAERILADVEAAQAALADELERPTGRVVLATPPSTAVLLARGLARLRDAHPGVEVTVRQAGPADALAGLRARDLDVAVVDDWDGAAEPARPGLHLDPLRRDEVVLALPRGHPAALDAPADRSTLARLHDERWICAPAGEPSREAFDRWLADVEGAPSARWEFVGLATSAALVAQGAGIALLPRLVLDASLGAAVVARPLEPARSRRIVAVTRSSAGPRPVIDLVVRSMAAAAEAP